MAKTPIFIVDAFVRQLPWRKVRGNPAAVVLLDAPRDTQWMQEVAAEMNLSETAFVVPKDKENFALRWFTPEIEVKLCGHATLASAHVLWETAQAGHDQTLRFHTQSGVLTARNEGDWIALDFPAQEVEACELPDKLRDALGLEAQYGPYPTFRAADDWLIEAAGEGQVDLLRPNFSALVHISRALNLRGIIVTAQPQYEGSGYDFVSRFFAPAVGIDEDPVTGSAHATLAPFWGERLQKGEMLGFQASKRGGLVRVKWNESHVEIAGKTVSALRGELYL